ncbi:hypothetical protein BJ138DRAFT_1106147 [Hygrophoropsis aurantiaca]|uniref:Uncharacterized protein n=1 Tax=Hygrophoropsis aurantiaca TaxID=72124 RepID=A0ACB7ZWK3_9AGAM|nr:hypothetical protein BJ138DRAFT_1106147 [Hygrophoropsis aurantiaca]
MEVFLFDDPIDFGKWRLEAEAAVQAVKSDEEADDDDRERMIDLEQKSGNDCASYQMIFFIGDLLAAFILNSVLDAKDKERAERAMARLVAISTIPVYRSAFALVRFAHAGGLPALMGDWAESTCKDGICKTAVETLPAKAWNYQTPESLLGIMRELINKVERDGSDITTTPVFANIMHQIYSRYGLDPFERASRLSDSEIIFYFLHRRLSKKTHKFQNAAESFSGWPCISPYVCLSSCPRASPLVEKVKDLANRPEYERQRQIGAIAIDMKSPTARIIQANAKTADS